MTWNAFHHRGEVLRRVIEDADRAQDGFLPLHAPGVAENFRDEMDLLAALLLKWHARLSGNIERVLTHEPLEPAEAVAAAWRRTSEQMPGVRAIIDRANRFPQGREMADTLARAQEKEWIRLAAAAGVTPDRSGRAAEAGQRIVRLARDEQEVAAPARPSGPTAREDEPSLADRIRAVLAA
jgi:hypothetical protein